MGWERRGQSGRMVYYRVTRTAEGKVVKQHLGRGERAATAAAAVARSQALGKADRQAVQEEQARLAGPDELTSELIRVAEVIQEAALFAAGYHRQNYGKWRKKRVQEESNRETASRKGSG